MTHEPQSGELKTIAVLGAGFGGLTALIKLYRRLERRGLLRNFELVLVDKRTQHTYTPALYEIASIPKGEAGAVCLKSSICIQIEDIIARFPGVRFLAGEVAGLDPSSRRLTFRSGGELSCAYAVIALGAETNYFAIPGLKEHACPLKTFEDAVRLRNRTEELLQSRTDLRVVIGGGGATGVELAAEFVNFLARLKTETAGERCRTEITLVEAAPDILPGFKPDVVRRARRRLRRLGVRIVTSSPIRSVTPSAALLLGGRSLSYDLLVWSGGVKPASVLANLGLALDRKGGVVVNEFLEAAPGIYAAGDCASFTNPATGKSLPWTVPVAEAEGRLAARNIAADIAGEPKRPFRPLASYPFILAVGGKYAITDLVLFKLSGFLGWTAKQLVELRYLLFILPAAKAIRIWLRAVYYSTRND